MPLPPDAQAIFLKFDLFTKRLNKLIDMFTTIHQFSTLEQHTHIEGLEQMIRNLNNIIDDVKRKPYDLLDFFRWAGVQDDSCFAVCCCALSAGLTDWCMGSHGSCCGTY